MKSFLRWTAGLMVLLVLVGQAPAEDIQGNQGQTPPRLSLLDGSVSFWRIGATDWSTAVLNTPMAPGDALYTDENANLELQIGNRAFVRAGERTQISVVNIEPDYLQFRVADGQASFDLRALPAGLTIEVNTPNAAFTIDRSGYYRLNVDQDTTSLVTRRGGRATVTPSGGRALNVSPSEELIVEGTDAPTVETYSVPELDRWDRWNYERTDHLVDALSSRYVPPDVYGAEALDNHGDWRVEPRYGALWVPAGVPSDWAPYSDGRWIWDAFYGWTWIDNAPWGWAPFHYGRWVHLNGYWAWAPGPIATRSVYSPALVAFFNNRGGSSVSVGIGAPGMSWVALSWGEPLVPWWGQPGFIGVPWWGGWHGPRVVKNVTQVTNITNVYQNTRVSHAVIASPRDQFGRDHARHVAVESSTLEHLSPMHGRHPIRPGAFSVQAGSPTDLRPTREVLSRPAVTVRAPREIRLPWKAEAPKGADTARSASAPELRFVPPPQRKQFRPAPFGKTGPERSAPTQAPRFDETRRVNQTAAPIREKNERQTDKPAVASPVPKRDDDRGTVAAPFRLEERRRPDGPATPAQENGERRVLQAPKSDERKPTASGRESPMPQIIGAPARRNDAAAPQRRDDQPRAQRHAEPPHPTIPLTSDESRRQAKTDGGPGKNAESIRRESTRDETRALPGNPANRLSPKRRGAGTPDENERSERSGGGRHN